METIPVEMLEMIVEQLTPQDLARCSAVCREWREVFNQDWMWRPRCDPELEEPLRTIPSVATPTFVTPEVEHSILSPICHWRLAYMKENHLWNNWRKEDFSKDNNIEIPHDKHVLSLDFLTDTLVVVWHIHCIKIMDVSKRTVELIAETNTSVDISDTDKCSVIGTKMLLVEKEFSVDIYSFDLAKKQITLKHSIPLYSPDYDSPVDGLTFIHAYPPVGADGTRVAKEQYYVFVNKKISSINIFDLNTGKLLKEEPYPVKVIESESEVEFIKVISSSTSNFVAATFASVDDIVGSYLKVYIYSIEQLTFLPDVIDIFYFQPSLVNIALHCNWLAYSEYDLFTVYNFETREVILRHRMAFGVNNFRVWDNSFILCTEGTVARGRWFKFSPEQKGIVKSEHQLDIRVDNIMNQKAIIGVKVENHIVKQYLWRLTGGMVMMIKISNDEFVTSKVNQSLTRIVTKKHSNRSCFVRFRW